MNLLSSNNLLAEFYLLLWLATCIWYHFKKMRLDAGSIIIFSYILYAFVSIQTLNDPIFSLEYEPLKLFPYLYLYVMMMIALAPAIYTHFHPTDHIENPNSRILTVIAIIIIICAIALIPNIINDSNGGLVKLLTDTDAGKDAYNEALKEISDTGSRINNIFAVLYNSLSDISTFLLFYFMTEEKKNKWLITGLFLSTFIGIAMPLMKGQRGGVIISVSTAIIGYFVFKSYINRKVNRLIQTTGIVVIGIIAIPIIAITVSRFGNASAGVSGYLNWYIGQGSLYFNNYGLDDDGIRYGDRTLNLFKRVIDPETSKNFAERRATYHYLKVNDDKFTTFVGDFTIDFGPLIAFLIFVVFNIWILYKIRTDNNSIKLHQLLLIYFSVCVSIQGGMSLFTYSDTANLRIICIFLLYGYLRYHEVLLKKYSLEESK